MLIKKKNLEKYFSGIIVQSGNGTTLTEAPSAADLEIQKAQQEAKLIKKEAEEVIKKAENKLKEAEYEANEIINSAAEEAEKIKEKTYKDTMKKATIEADKIKNQAKELLKKLFEVKREALHQAHGQIINIALDLTEKIIKYQVAADTNVLKIQVIEAIKKATTDADRIQVFVNPQDLNTLQKSINDIKQLFPIGIEIIALSSDEVDLGSCFIETKSGQLDARFSTQLKALRELVFHLEVKEPNIPLEIEFETEEEVKEDVEIIEEDFSQEEKELLEEIPLIEFPGEEETFPFSKEPQNLEIEEPVEIPEEVVKEIKKESPPGKKKLTINIQPEFEQEDELDEEETEKPESGSILKKKTNGISKIANDVEKDPEWKTHLKDND